MKKVTIWHTNDVHSRFENFAAIADWLEENAGKEDLILDSGDLADERSPLVSGSKGAFALRLVKEAGYQAVTAGNNEYLAGQEAILSMSSELPLLGCNVRTLKDEAVEGLTSHILLKKAGLRFLIIGVSPYWDIDDESVEFCALVNLKVHSPEEDIRRILEEEKGNYDIVVLLSHAGLAEDRKLAQSVEGIDLILGGHSHDLLEETEEVSGCHIHQSGKWAQHLGKITLELDGNRICSVRAKNSSPEIKPGNKWLMRVRELEEAGKEQLAEILYVLPKDLKADPFRECEAANALADCLFAEHPCDFAMIHQGVLNKDIPKEISRLSLLEACPSILNPALIKWTGRQIKEALQASLDEEFIHKSGIGPGFRGEVLGTLAFSHNVRIKENTLFVDGKEIEEDRLYTVMSDDYLFRGIGYKMLAGEKKNRRYFAGYLRDLLERRLKDPQVVQKAEIRRKDA